MTYLASATLLLLAPLGAFLHAGGYPLLRAEVAGLVCACVGTGALLSLIVLRARAAAALLLGALAALAIDLAFALRDWSAWLMLFMLAACLAAAWGLRRHIATILLAAASVFLLTSFVFQAPPKEQLPPAVAHSVGESWGGRADLPVVLHVVLDEHIGIDGLPGDFPESARLARSLTDFYVRRGFRLHASAYSEYYWTLDSLPNLMNFASRDRRRFYVSGPRGSHVLTANAYFAHLARLGYRLHVYQSHFLDFCSAAAAAKPSCVTFNAERLGAVSESGLAVPEKAKLVAHLFAIRSAYFRRAREEYERMRASVPGAPLPEWKEGPRYIAPVGALPLFRRLERDLRSALPGNAYFAHLLLPHNPYALDGSCRVYADLGGWLHRTPHIHLGTNTVESRRERYRKYADQLACVPALLGALFEAMGRAGVWRDATVIVHGDHGSRILRREPVAGNASKLEPEDYRDAFSTLFAIRSSGREGGVVREARSLQKLLGDAFAVAVEESSPKVYLEEGEALKAHDLPAFRRDADPHPSPSARDRM